MLCKTKISDLSVILRDRHDLHAHAQPSRTKSAVVRVANRLHHTRRTTMLPRSIHIAISIIIAYCIVRGVHKFTLATSMCSTQKATSVHLHMT